MYAVQRNVWDLDKHQIQDGDGARVEEGCDGGKVQEAKTSSFNVIFIYF